MHSIEIRTNRLLLRPYRLEDVDDVYAYAADQVWARYLLPISEPYTRQHAIDFVTAALDRWAGEDRAFAVVKDEVVIGGVSLRVDLAQHRAEIGYSLSRDHWGQGLTPEAVRAVIDWAFQNFAVEKVYALADARNVQSVRVMEKLGMRREGLLRKTPPLSR